jgi:hypothetical protein
MTAIVPSTAANTIGHTGHRQPPPGRQRAGVLVGDGGRAAGVPVETAVKGVGAAHDDARLVAQLRACASPPRVHPRARVRIAAAAAAARTTRQGDTHRHTGTTHHTARAYTHAHRRARAWRTGVVDLHHAAVGHRFHEPQEEHLVICRWWGGGKAHRPGE